MTDRTFNLAGDWWNAGFATNYTQDGRPIVVEGAVSVEVVSPPTWWIVGVWVAAAFLPSILVHLICFHDPVGQRTGGKSVQGPSPERGVST